MIRDDGEQPNDRSSLIARLRPVFEARGYEGATLGQLAGAAGLSKASLYHHFPGGKAEMIDALLRQSISELQQWAFASLDGEGAAKARLRDFVKGFVRYLDHGQRHCLVAVLAQGSLQERLGGAIADQYESWIAQLGRVFEEAGERPKRARRSAEALLAELYGFLLLGQLCHRPALVKRASKRIYRRLDDLP
jgi:AcrR family transcriptional regulator